MTLSREQTSLCSCPISSAWNHLLSSLSEVIFLSLSHLSPKHLGRGTHQEEKEAPALVLSIIPLFTLGSRPIIFTKVSQIHLSIKDFLALTLRMGTGC